MAVLIGLMIAAEFYSNWVHPAARDFIAFWGASQFALSGQPALAYDNAALNALQSKVVTFAAGAEMPFPYAPVFLLLTLPFGIVSYPAGLILWSFAGYAIYLVVVHRLYPGRAWVAAAFPPVFATAVLGQNGFVMAAIFLGGLLLLPKRPFTAGLLLGCLVLKPQLALLLPVAMLAARQWRAVAGAIASSIAVMLLGLLLFGPAATQAWLDQLPLFAAIARDGLVGWHKFVSVYASARQIGVPETAAFAIHATVALAAAVAVWRIWSANTDWPARFAILSAATMLASPYLYVYDTLILIPAFVYLVGRRAPIALVALAWLLPIATMIQVASGAWPVNIGPLSAIILVALIWCHAGDRRAKW
jgi:alpha-1,2-mannosyltransferase